ncbi:MAG TPA: endonuclease/exonuclease/phosphatase family protein [Usitatibacter sp.]|nr:endonuclease/exonuclease/phosphatase family protein [Usitatibacter sp.]
MKLVTWNIQWGRGVDGRVDLARIASTARGLADFDVLCLQEVADNFPGLEGNDDRDQFAELARLLPGYRAAESIAVESAAPDGRCRRFGNVLFSRYPILAVRRHALPWPADASAPSMPRALVEVVVQAPMGPLRIGTTHLEYYSAVQRAAQARYLRHVHEEACARAAGPAQQGDAGTPFETLPATCRAILTGDFNFPVDDPGHAEIQQASPGGAPPYRDAWRVVHAQAPHPPTFCLHEHGYGEEPYCCDFIFVSADLAPRVRSIRVDVDTQASDHQPVIAEIDDLQEPACAASV